MLHSAGVCIRLARGPKRKICELANTGVFVAGIRGALIGVAARNLARNLVENSKDVCRVRRFEVVRGIRIRRYKFHAVLVRNRDVSKEQCKDFNAVGGLEMVRGRRGIGQGILIATVRKVDEDFVLTRRARAVTQFGVHDIQRTGEMGAGAALSCSRQLRPGIVVAVRCAAVIVAIR